MFRKVQQKLIFQAYVICIRNEQNHSFQGDTLRKVKDVLNVEFELSSFLCHNILDFKLLVFSLWPQHFKKAQLEWRGSFKTR